MGILFIVLQNSSLPSRHSRLKAIRELTLPLENDISGFDLKEMRYRLDRLNLSLSKYRHDREEIIKLQLEMINLKSLVKAKALEERKNQPRKRERKTA